MSGLVIQNRPLQAPWPESLKPVPLTRNEKIKKIFWDIISVLIPFILLGRWINHLITRAISAWVVLPAQSVFTPGIVKKMKEEFHQFWTSEEPISMKNGWMSVLKFRQDVGDLGGLSLQAKILNTRAALCAHFTPIHDTILTPEGVEISITLLRHKNSDASTPTLIHFNGNSEYSLATGDVWPLVESVETGVPRNYVLFDYQNVGDSKGPFPLMKQLILSGISVVHWVREVMRTPDPLIQFYGKSLGGLVAVETQALEADRLTGAHLNQVSLSNFEEMVHSNLINRRIANWAIATLNKRGFVADGAAAFRKLKGPKMIIRHPHDEVIPKGPSLQEAVKDDQDHRFLELAPKQIYIEESHRHNHVAPLEWHEGAVETAGAFLRDELGAVQDNAS